MTAGVLGQYTSAFAAAFGITTAKDVSSRRVDLKFEFNRARARTLRGTRSTTTHSTTRSIRSLQTSSTKATAAAATAAKPKVVTVFLQIESPSRKEAAEIIAAEAQNPSAFKSNLLQKLQARSLTDVYSTAQIRTASVSARDANAKTVDVKLLLNENGYSGNWVADIITSLSSSSSNANSNGSGSQSIGDKIEDLAKKATEGLTIAEIAGISLSALCAIGGLIFAWYRHRGDKKKQGLQMENVKLERKRIEATLYSDGLAAKNAMLDFDRKKMEVRKAKAVTEAVLMENQKKRIEIHELQRVYSNQKPLGLVDMEKVLTGVEGASAGSSQQEQPKKKLKRKTLKNMASAARMLMGKEKKGAGIEV